MVQIGAEMVPWFGGRRAEDGRRRERETITLQRLPGPSTTYQDLPYVYRDDGEIFFKVRIGSDRVN